jgi:hypothetical protein
MQSPEKCSRIEHENSTIIQGRGTFVLLYGVPGMFCVLTLYAYGNGDDSLPTFLLLACTPILAYCSLRAWPMKSFYLGYDQFKYYGFFAKKFEGNYVNITTLDINIQTQTLWILTKKSTLYISSGDMNIVALKAIHDELEKILKGMIIE